MFPTQKNLLDDVEKISHQTEEKSHLGSCIFFRMKDIEFFIQKIQYLI